MNKKTIIILVIVLVLSAGAFGGYKYYRYYMKKHQPNNNLPDLEDEVIPTPKAPSPIVYRELEEQLAKAKEPEFTDVQAEASSLYPTLSGKHEPIWDDYEAIPIDIAASGNVQMEASYKLIWAKKYLYVQVTVKDSTKDTSGEKYSVQDSVEFFVNEDGKKNSTLRVGDAHYVVNRDNLKALGFGADESFESVTYELDPVTDENGNTVKPGYVVEVIIPLMTIKASKNNSIGFDIQVNNAVDGKLVSIYKWASNYLYTFQNFSAVGTLTFK